MRSIEDMKHILFLGVIAILLGGCVKNYPDPVWLEIDEWSLVSNPLSEEDPGHLSHNFTDVWVYVDNKLVGVFELPCKIPVMVEGEGKSIRLYPTVRNNGIAATKKIYPFVEPFEQSYDCVPGSTISIHPTTRYVSNCEFWLEDFESSSAYLTTDPASDATMEYGTDPNEAISGTYGHIALGGEDSLWLGVTEAISLPGSGAEVYLEIDYKCSITVEQGVLAFLSDGSSQTNHYVYLNAQPASTMVWRKMYIDLKEIVSYSVNAVEFQQYLTAALSENASSGDIYIDNVRLVHF